MSPRDRIRTLALTTGLHFFTHALGTLLPPLYLLIQADLGLDRVSRVTLGITIYSIGYTALSLPWGMVADRGARKPLLVLGLLVHGAAFVALTWCHSYGCFLGLMALAGAAGSCYHPPGNALVTALGGERPGRFIGLAGIGAALGFTVAPWYAGWRAQTAGWRAPCLEAGLAAVVMAALFWRLASEPPSRRRTTRGTSREEARLLGYIAVVALAMTLRDFGALGVSTAAVLFLQRIHGFDVQQTGMMLGAMTATSLVVNPIVGSVSDGPRRLHWLAGLIAVSAMGAVCVPWLPRSMVLLPLLLHGAGVLGSYPVGEAALGESVPDALRGRLFGLLVTVIGLVSSLAPWVTGKAVDAMGAGPEARISFVALFAALGLLTLGGASAAPALAWARRRMAEQEGSGASLRNNGEFPRI